MALCTGTNYSKFLMYLEQEEENLKSLFPTFAISGFLPRSLDFLLVDSREELAKLAVSD